MDRHRYARLTIEGDRKTGWMCGCFLTEDDYFKFCPRHNEYLKRAVLAQIDELDMTVVVDEGGGGGNGEGSRGGGNGEGSRGGGNAPQVDARP